ncbi:MAG: ABC transporter substrate-binding protein [Cardiobacteriaceae bacterium]|nr:ABC transporter substrate-binding protein [Cardiobacteriaceae bacterium]
MRLSALFLGIFTAFTVFNAAAFEVQTKKGAVEIKETPKKAAVLDVGVLDNLAALEVEAAATPDKLRPDFVASAHKNAKTFGSMREIDFAKIANVEPDLIIVSGRSAQNFDEAAKIAQTIDLSIEGDSFDATLNRLATLGKIFGKEDKATEITAHINKLFDETKTAAQGKTGKALIILANDGKLSLFGKESRLGWIEKLGFELIDKEADKTADGKPARNHGGTKSIDAEFIKNADADWIFVVDRAKAIGQKDASSAEDTLAKAGIAETKAAKNNRLIYLSPAEIYIDFGGIIALEHTLNELKEAFSK